MKKGQTHRVSSLLQFPIKSGILPVKLLPSIRLKPVCKDQKFPIPMNKFSTYLRYV